LAKRPAEEILFGWFRSSRLVGELSVLIKRMHPDVQADIDRFYQEHLAKLGKRRRDPAAQDDCLFWAAFPALEETNFPPERSVGRCRKESVHAGTWKE
jgi:hypothetical protein